MKREDLARFPLNGTFELTARCNLSCKMCLVRIDNKRMAELGGRERTAEEWIHMAQEVQEAGTIGILLTGGEPMLRPDFIQIYKAIAQMGFMLTLYTNATLVTEEIMEVLREFPPHVIGITTYGASPDTYRKVTGNANAYHRMLEGVEQLRRLPSKFIIRTTLIKDNIDDLNEITDWALKFGNDVEFNVARIVTKPVRGGIADVESCRLTPEQSLSMLEERYLRFQLDPLIKFLNDNPEQIKSNEIRTSNEINEEKKHLEFDKTLYGCEAGMISYTISWDGKLIGCQMLGDCWTYPFEIGFKQAWDDFPYEVKLPPLPEQCANCDATCSACTANRLAETGNLNGIPEYLCKESKLAKELDHKLMNRVQEIIEQKGYRYENL